MGAGEDGSPARTVEERLDWVEQRNRDADKLLQEEIDLVHGLVQDQKTLAARIKDCERRLDQLLPDVENCPKCGRKVNKGARRCDLCGHRW